jgi:tricarballylate dehydrogenase
MADRQKCDIIVIGAGSAAFEAAVAARQAGAGKVVMLEKAPPEQSGGNAQFSHTGFRFVFSGKEEVGKFLPDVEKEFYDSMEIPPYTPDMFMADLNLVSGGRIDPVLAQYMVDNSNRALHWMRETGIKWEPDKPMIVDGRRHYEPGIVIHPQGGGRGQLKQWRAIAEGLGIEVRFRSRASAVIGDDRQVEGVRVSTPDDSYELYAPATIACSGGFQANPEMRAAYLGPTSDTVRVRGSRHNTGEVLRMMLNLGAKAAGQWNVAHASPIDVGAPMLETPLNDLGTGNTMNRYDYRFGITVNSRAERFYDEGENFIAYTYAKTGREVLAQPGGVAYQIYDDSGIDQFRHGRDYPATVIEARSLPELATKIGLNPAVLVATVDTFNKSIVSTNPFNPSQLDGRGTVGLPLPKSNWAVPIDTPPFRAYPITCGITFTFGGVAINTRGEVLNQVSEPIGGLYASGDVIGLFFNNYPAMTGQTRNVVFSHAAGTNAANAAK